MAVELGATRVRELKVSGAFHTSLMIPAQPRLRKAIDVTTFHPLAMPVVANVDSLPHDAAGEWPSLMSAQLRSPVRWRQTVLSLAAMLRTGEWDGDDLFCELGPGGPLSAMIRATVPEAVTVAIAVPDDLDTLVGKLTGESAPGMGADGGPPRGAPVRVRAPGHQPLRRHLRTPGGHARGPRRARAGTRPAAPAAPTPVAAAPAGSGEPRAGEPGTPIEIGDLLGLVSGTEVRSPFAGHLMGLLAHPGERVQAGQPVAWLRSL